MRTGLVILLLLVIVFHQSSGWGFFAHKMINRQAVFSLPPEMIGFYKEHIHLIAENAVNPDRRRYTLKDEAPRHYIDIDHYGDSAVHSMPRNWDKAVDLYSNDTLIAYGIVPWHLSLMKARLTAAFTEKNLKRILFLSADIGHYIADANVPLHTTKNYNGQLTGQDGIHGLWESRLPELFHSDYDLFVGQSQYVVSPNDRAWQAVLNAHLAVDSVLTFEKALTLQISSDKKFGYEQRGSTFTRVYSREFSNSYHRMLSGMVERQFRASIKMVADFWFTCWVDAGQPDLTGFQDELAEDIKLEMENNRKGWIRSIFNGRQHESDEH